VLIDLDPGDLLGQGADAVVHEMTVQGLKVAWKRTLRHRKSIANVRLEIEVLKKLSHRHLILLISSYTHKRSVGLLYPVAVCDLGTSFENAKACLQDNAANDQELRLRKLGYPSGSSLKHKAWPIYSQIGCFLSAVAYLHSQNIRHKDIKPSNILLSRSRLWLSDFGLARDFFNLSDSGTDGGAGTVRYKAPEVNQVIIYSSPLTDLVFLPGSRLRA
jgi:serine/threonine protein kinase